MPRRSRARYLDTSYGAAAVSVGIEEVDSQHWIDKVYNPEITGK
jgi:hypothetical protein